MAMVCKYCVLCLKKQSNIVWMVSLQMWILAVAMISFAEAKEAFILKCCVSFTTICHIKQQRASTARLQTLDIVKLCFQLLANFSTLVSQCQF